MSQRASVQRKTGVSVRGVMCGRMWRERALRILREGERGGACGPSRRLSRRDGDGDRRPWEPAAAWKRGELGLREEEYESYDWAGGRDGGDSAVDGIFGRGAVAIDVEKNVKEDCTQVVWAVV